MKVWTTFEALTMGIREAIFVSRLPESHGIYVLFENSRYEEWIPAGSWFKTRKGAVNSAERQRKAKIIQLENQIERLQRKVFE